MRALIVLLATTCAANAGGVNLQYESFYATKGRAKIVLKLENNTGFALKMVVAECAFLDGKRRAIDTATLIASNVEMRGSVYVDGWSARIDGIEQADCRISSFR